MCVKKIAAYVERASYKCVLGTCKQICLQEQRMHPQYEQQFIQILRPKSQKT